MEEMAGHTTEVSRVIASVSLEYYAQAAPAALAARLARLHQNAWEAAMSGGSAESAFGELHRYSDKLLNGREVVEMGDQHIVWALTPVLAASLACAPGDEHVSLREVGGALWRMLNVALEGVGALDPQPARQAA